MDQIELIETSVVQSLIQASFGKIYEEKVDGRNDKKEDKVTSDITVSLFIRKWLVKQTRHSY